ncbi:thiamine ABC transporter substrate binding subunit [Blastococcus sp. Marseille-P5729]|uniref:thiamine ABC transporter substrate-binding protein n=1 Tax=Blastococcus sp. Marseille-P5729 TaxID=2086582 RepID=UPI000D0F243A|nr:thiamine ABC transporter substrate-binding protein [Blastococcus sp. Marseille-P5729]
MSKHRGAAATLATIACAFTLTACGVDSGSSGQDAESTVTVMTHDSWNAPEELIEQFEKDSGFTVEIQAGGDAGEVTNKLILSKDAPVADVVFGVDNTFASRPIEEDVLEPYESPAQSERSKELALAGTSNELTAIDFGDVCLNVDNEWFAANGIVAPSSLEDLIKPEYKDLFVTPSAVTSSPGMAFFLATVAKYGETGWQDYWTALLANGAKITNGWTDAYSVDFSGGEGNGARPIVLSYASSPPFTIPEGGSEPTTSAVLSTCFRQVEYAGIVKGADNVEGAQAFIDFISGTEFQKSIPDNMYMYPASDVELPEAWATYAPLSTEPLVIEPEKIAANRDAWLKEWADVTSS